MPKCDFNKVPNSENNFMKSEIKHFLISTSHPIYTLDTERKLNVHKTFRRCS